MSLWLCCIIYCVIVASALRAPFKKQARAVMPLNSMGSDMLIRPDDEDSPEFKEYLKALLTLQANRAKTGYSAPSSGSSDAYVAKLNRIKVERNALRAAGLPVDIVDTSYKPEDYSAALYESQEPLVSNTVLTGDAALPGRAKAGSKARPLTREELEMQAAAEKAVAEARLKAGLSPEVSGANSAAVIMPSSIPAAVITQKADPSMKKDFDLIDKLLVSKGLLSGAAATQPAPRQQPATSAPAAPVTPAKPAPVARSAPLPPKPEPAAPAVAVPAVPLRTMPAQSIPVSAVVTEGKKLSKDELEITAEALQLLLKHRGGGQFGAGRLTDPREIQSLETALRRSVAIIEAADSSLPPVSASASPSAVSAPTSASTSISSKVPPPSAPAKPLSPTAPPAQPVAASPAPSVVTPKRSQPPSSPSLTSATTPVTSTDKKTAPPPSTTSLPTINNAAPTVSDASSTSMPIAIGLDKFLLAPKQASNEELEALRDGLIQCLSLVYNELTSRPSSPPPSPVPPPIEDPTERILRTSAQGTSVPSSTVAVGESNARTATDAANEMTIEQETKIALGLLLKHRGGPGFGHGRLQGKELDLLASKLRSVTQRIVAESASVGR